MIDFPALSVYNYLCRLRRENMGLKGTLFRLSILFTILFTFSLLSACSTPSWFPIKKGPPHKAKMKELVDKEIVIIDGREHVKVLNPGSSERGNQPKYLYVPVDEYLSKRELYTPSILKKREEAKEESLLPSLKPSPSASEGGAFPPAPSLSRSRLSDLKKKVVIAYFDDRTTSPEEEFGDWVAEKLVKEVTRRAQSVLFVDYQTVKEFLEKRGVVLKDLETPTVLRLLNEVFGVHALVLGQLSGPYVFTTKASQDQEATASAILKIEMRLLDTFSGKTLKNLSTNNSIIPTKETGTFSAERSKMKAIDLTISDLSRSLSKELDGLDWFGRVAKVEGEEIYLNAGRLTGIKVGDVMEVFRPGGPADREEVKGRIQISAWFGIDAAIGKRIQGKEPEVNDILKIAQRNPNIHKGM